MLKREYRLTKDKEFDNVFKNGRRAYNQLLGVRAIKNNLDISRFGILVNLKVSKKAHLRNRIKRQIRAIIQEELFLLKGGHDVVIIVFPLILANNFEEIKEALRASWQKLKIY